MGLKTDNIRNADVSVILNKFLDKFNGIYDNYKYCGISENEYLDLVRNEILLSKKQFNGSCEYDAYITNNVKSALSKIIEFNLYDDVNGFVILDNYINQKFIPSDNYDSSIKNIKKFAKFLETYDYKLADEHLVKLISENSIFCNSMREIVKKKIDVIQCGDITSIFNDLNIQSMIKVYCSQNGIKIDNEIDEDLYFDDSYKAFCHEIRKIPLLTIEEEKNLLCEAKNGNKIARDKLVNSNLRFVVKIANNFINRGIPPLDLVQEGSLGLIEAIDAFDLTRDIKFLTYAGYHIKKRIIRSIYNNSRNIRLPWQVHVNLNKYRNAVNELIEELKRNPNAQEIADHMNIPVDKVRELMRLQDDTVSINELVSENTELGDLVSDKTSSTEESIMSNSLVDDVQEILESGMLDDREREIMKLRYGFEDGRPWKLREIGDKFGITRERVNKIEIRVLRRLKYSLNSRSLVGYSEDPDKNIADIRNSRASKNNTDLKRRHNHKENDVINTVYENFAGYTKDQVNSVIYQLDPVDIKLIKKKYGNRFIDTPKVKSLSKTDSFMFYTSLVPKMRQMLATLYSRKTKKEAQKVNSF